MNHPATILPISTPVKPMLSPEVQNFVNFMANIIVEQSIKQANEKRN